MVARSGKLKGVVSQGRRTKTRRRFDIALGIPGAEVRLPAVPVIRVGWRALSGILVVLILGLLYTLWNSSIYHVKAAEIEGINRLMPQEVNTVLKVAGESIFTVEPRNLEKDLQEAFPELFNISVQVQFPADVLVMVEERRPVLAWHQDGLTLWVDEHGVAFPPRGEAEIPVTVDGLDKPQSGPVTEEGTRVFLEPKLIPTILTVGKNVPQEKPLIYDGVHGLGWKDPQGWQVFIGRDVGGIETKLQVYEAIITRLEQDQIVPVLINIEHVDAPFYRMDR
jgi:hypothetical protein